MIKLLFIIMFGICNSLHEEIYPYICIKAYILELHITKHACISSVVDVLRGNLFWVNLSVAHSIKELNCLSGNKLKFMRK
jgi:hypothetical protein